MYRSDIIQILQEDLDAIYIGNLNTVDTDLELPLRGKKGSAFTWSTGEARFITAEGKVHRPLHGMGNRKVLLTVVGELEGETGTREFTATVIQQAKETIVEWIRPVELTVKAGESSTLPSVVIVKCRDGRSTTLPVSWINKEASRTLAVPGTYEYTGILEGTELRANARVRVVEVCPVEPVPTRKLEYLPIEDVRLLPGTVNYDYQQRMVEYLLAQDDDSMLYNFRTACGLDTQGAAPMTGWDEASCNLKGHTTGHYLSGLALAWAATKNERILAKTEYMVDELKKCQEAFAVSGEYHRGFLSAYSEEQFDLLEVYTRYPEIWAPYYTLDKIMSGLYDIYTLTGNEKALEIESLMGDWVYDRLSRLPKTQLDRMWSMYIAGEYGGMLGTMVKLYEATGREEHLQAAKLFENEKLFYPMAENVDTLEDMHGNQHIPQIIGAVDMFRATADPGAWKIGRNFWEIVTGGHIYCVGGVGETEMFHGANTTCSYLTEKAAESCASYNMLRLTGELFAYTADAGMMDYYDNTLRNHIMTSCSHTDDGGTIYFLPLCPGGQKEYSTTENTCCHGTGMESRFRYMEHIYAVDEAWVYVNLFVDSVLDSTDKCAKLRQTLSDEGVLRIQVETLGGRGLKIRIPAWARERFCLKCGEGAAVPEHTMEDGWLAIKPEDGAVIEGKLPMEIRILENVSDASFTNVAYGPWILAALDSREEFLPQPTPGKTAQGLEFADGMVRMIPLNRVDDEKYHVYFRRR